MFVAQDNMTETPPIGSTKSIWGSVSKVASVLELIDVAVVYPGLKEQEYSDTPGAISARNNCFRNNILQRIPNCTQY